jgi:hypothetical protein
MTRKHFRKALNRIAADRGDTIRVWSQGAIDKALRSGTTPEQFYQQQKNELHNMDKKIDLRHLLERADAVRIDGGPVLDSWEWDEDGVLTFRWEADGLNYSSVHDEENLKYVEVVGKGVLRLADCMGEATDITLLTLSPMEDPCFDRY